MTEADEILSSQLRSLPRKPGEDARQSDKKRYSELMSAAAAFALSEALRRKGLKGTLPSPATPAQLATENQHEPAEDLE